MLRDWMVAAAIAVIWTGGCWAADVPSAVSSDDWLTYGYDQQRSDWNQGEKTLTQKNNLSAGCEVAFWTTQLDVQPLDAALSTLTSASRRQWRGVNTAQGSKNLLFTVGINDTLYAIDAEGGKVIWQSGPTSQSRQTRADREHQLFQHRAGDAGDRSGQSGHLLHHERWKVARAGYRVTGERATDGVAICCAIQPQLGFEPDRRCRLYGRRTGLRWRPAAENWIRRRFGNGRQ